jgi:hypothetical protein
MEGENMEIETSAYGPVTLGGLIHALERRQFGEDGKPRYVRFAFGGLVPTKLNSYRGYYSELALGFEDPSERHGEPNVPELLAMLKKAVGATYTGWKGGEYTMDTNTAIFVANSGDSTQCGITGIYANDGYQIVLLTDYFG